MGTYKDFAKKHETETERKAKNYKPSVKEERSNGVVHQIFKTLFVLFVFIVMAGIVYYVYSNFKDSSDPPSRSKELRESMEKFIGEQERKEVDQIIKGCKWYKDECPNGNAKTINLAQGKDFKWVGEDLGLIFLKADYISGFDLACCEHFYFLTDRVVDWGMIRCDWSSIPGDCAREHVVGKDLSCMPTADSSFANTVIKKCMREAELHYWCCPEE